MEEKEEILKKAGKNIAGIRKNKNIALEELSGILKIEKSCIEKIEKGEDEKLTLSMIFKIAEALGVEPQDIVK